MDESKKLTLNDREVGLYYCLGASRELAALTGGLEHAKEYLNGNSTEIMDKTCKIILLLNRWWCKAAACNGTQVEPITQDELDLYFDPAQMPDYVAAISEAIEKGTKRMVKTTPIPSKGKNAVSGRKRSS